MVLAPLAGFWRFVIETYSGKRASQASSATIGFCIWIQQECSAGRYPFAIIPPGAAGWASASGLAAVQTPQCSPISCLLVWARPSNGILRTYPRQCLCKEVAGNALPLKQWLTLATRPDTQVASHYLDQGR